MPIVGFASHIANVDDELRLSMRNSMGSSASDPDESPQQSSQVEDGIERLTEMVQSLHSVVGEMAQRLFPDMAVGGSCGGSGGSSHSRHSRKGSKEVKVAEPAEEVTQSQTMATTPTAKCFASIGRTMTTKLKPGGHGSSIFDEKTAELVAPTLPLGWPRVVQMRSVAPLHRKSQEEWLSQAQVSEITTNINGEATEQLNLKCRFVRDPNSWLCVTWEIVGMLVLAYDLVTVPYILAWEVNLTGGLLYISYGVLCFWTLDIVMSFLRGVYVDGELITRLITVAGMYMKSWFLLDISIVTCEWLGIALAMIEKDADGGSTESLRILRMAKMGKLLRLLGALRIFRLARLVESFMQRSLSENTRMGLRIGALAFSFLWLNHMVTCAWFAIGRGFGSETGMHWIYTTWTYNTGEETLSVSFLETGGFYQYITAFHWAMAQTTLGAMEVLPTNGWERTFNVICLLIGLLCGSTLVSSLSATMVEVQVRNRDRSQKLSTLRRYLNEHHISRTVALQVQRQVGERLAQRTALTGKDVTALEILSPSLQVELHSEICRPSVSTHPLMRVLAHMGGGWYRKFCGTVPDVVCVRAKDDVFVAGQNGVSCSMLVQGAIAYRMEPETSWVESKEVTQVAKNTWISEAVLFTEWIHVGTAEAATSCQLVQIQPEAFWEAVHQHLLAVAVSREYCIAYHQRIIAAMPPQTDSYPTDLSVPNTDFGDIVSSMSEEAQRQIGLISIAIIEAQTRTAPTSHIAINHHSFDSRVGQRVPAARRKGQGLEQLRQEVLDGTSVVVLNHQGQAMRVVSIVILSVDNADSHTLWEIGNVEFSRNWPRVQLPATKRHRNELTIDTLNRLLATKLAPLTDQLDDVERMESMVEEKQSKDIGVNTRYLRKVCHVRIKEESFALQACTFAFESEAQESSEGSGAEQSANASTPRRSETQQEMEAVATLGKRFFEKEVFFVPIKREESGNDGGTFFCWLSEADAKWLKSAEGEPVLQEWIRGLRLPQALRRAVRASGYSVFSSACNVEGVLSELESGSGSHFGEEPGSNTGTQSEEADSVRGV